VLIINSMGTIGEEFQDIIGLMKKQAKQPRKITEKDVYQEANMDIRGNVNKILSHLMLPESTILGSENILELSRLAKQGKSCLVLMEHYSNFDIPCFYCLLDNIGPEVYEAANTIIQIAGMKLNEESELVKAFSEGYTRIVIYPERSIGQIQDAELREKEKKRSQAINLASLRWMISSKHSGHPFLVFPTGTRYRPGDPSTKRGLKSVDSYMRSFDYMVQIGVCGNILTISDSGKMTEDVVSKDIIMYNIGTVKSCREFRKEVHSNISEGADPKQQVVDEVMRELDILHAVIEEKRGELLKNYNQN
jgi:glycerol-3-phosphate O-acyltransferase